MEHLNISLVLLDRTLFSETTHASVGRLAQIFLKVCRTHSQPTLDANTALTGSDRLKYLNTGRRARERLFAAVAVFVFVIGRTMQT